jgi:DNA-binding XRE family transcriptional regulator
MNEVALVAEQLERFTFSIDLHCRGRMLANYPSLSFSIPLMIYSRYQPCYNPTITSETEKEQEVLVEGPAIYKPKTKIRELRHQKFMTMAELAQEAGVAFQTVVRVEHGNPAKAGTIRKIAKALGVEPSELAE